MFEKAIALDPQYARGVRALGWTYLREWLWFNGVRTPRPWSGPLDWRKGPRALDDSLPVAHGLLGVVYAVERTA